VLETTDYNSQKKKCSDTNDVVITLKEEEKKCKVITPNS
jgi:hypothetical protein